MRGPCPHDWNEPDMEPWGANTLTRHETMKDKSKVKYVTAIRRILRAAGQIMTDEATITDLEARLRDVTRVAPGVTARGLSRMFKDAARAWVYGNNSGNNAIMDRAEAKSDELQETAERVIQSVSPVTVKIDYPGLYPSFYIERGSSGKDSGHFYDCESLCRAIAEHLKGGAK